MNKIIKKALAVVVPFLTKLAKPWLDAIQDETGRKPVVAPVVQPVLAQAPVVKVTAPIPLTVIPAPVLLTLNLIKVPSTAPRTARTTTLYRKAKRGDRYEVATNPQPGDVLYVKVPRGKTFRYQQYSPIAA